MLVDLKAEAGFNLNAEAEYKLRRTYIAEGYVWTHVLNNRVADYTVGDRDMGGMLHANTLHANHIECCVSPPHIQP